uniref:Uncharacterized protein n=1 Tax=Ananas comosus var. bracteatus TaxID=296719 RepID=A0A6V7Q082_ANACO|nr:unnamed protein product [Ananas comosus var. bracteatus]
MWYRQRPPRQQLLAVKDAIDFLISRPITKGPIWQDNTKRSDSPSVSGQVLNDYLFGGPTRDELDCCGVHKFSQPGIFLRTEVAMHVLNKMQKYGKNNPVTADFCKECGIWIRIYTNSVLRVGTLCGATAGHRMRHSCWPNGLRPIFEHILGIPVGAPDVIFHKECQQQGSIEVDCGMYTCLFAERLVRNGLPDLSLYDNDPSSFRAHMVSAILKDPCCLTYTSMIECIVAKDDV